MPVAKIACPHCSAAVRVGSDAAGRRFRCPQCDNVFAVPAAKDAVPLPKAASRLVTTLVVVAALLILVAGVLGVAGGVGFMLLIQRRETPSVAKVESPTEPAPRQSQAPPPVEDRPAPPAPKPLPKNPIPDPQPAPKPPADPQPPAKDRTPPLQKQLVGEWEWKTGEDTVQFAFEQNGTFTITGPMSYLDEQTNEYRKFNLRLHGEYQFRSDDTLDLELKGFGKTEGAEFIGSSKIAFPDANQLVLTNTKNGIVTKLTRVKR